MSNRFYKTRKNRLIAGVVAGLADKFGWDLALARILAIILMVSTQFGIFLYLVLALLLPYKEDIYPEVKLRVGEKAKTLDLVNFFYTNLTPPTKLLVLVSGAPHPS